MNSLNADSFYFFSNEYFSSLANWSQAQLAICTHKGEPIAGAIFFWNNSFMEYHLSAATDLGKSLSATNLIIHEGAMHAQKIGCKQLNLGGGSNHSPENPLFLFKSNFSHLRAPFKIGMKIHLEAQYSNLKKIWEQKNQISHKFLFYR